MLLNGNVRFETEFVSEVFPFPRFSSAVVGIVANDIKKSYVGAVGRGRRR